MTTTTPDFAAVLDALRDNERFLVVTHENPDGDALGSMLGTTLGLRDFGKDVVMYLSGDAPLPGEFGFLPLGDLRRDLPDDVEDRVLLAVDCANQRRISPVTDAVDRARLVVNVDHHHDNSRFGKVNLIVAHASSTAEIVRDLLAALDVPLTPEIAEALYVGLVTDTGRFQYRTTSPAALRLGARLVEAGVDVHKVFERVFESMQPGKLRLLGRVIDHAVAYFDGRLLISHVTRDDLALVEGDEATTEGLIDTLRSVEGVQVAGLIREQVPLGDGSITPNRVSLRSRGLIDVSAIARRSSGGGHKQAAGFAHPGSVEDIREFIVSEVSAQLAETAA
jgi:bifunctional oligoribonuclease and PAP phosphatase NrnA